MASGPIVLDAATLITADRTNNAVIGSGSHGHASFILRLTAITRTTGTLDVFLRWSPDGGTNRMIVATVAGVTATGNFIIPVTSDFAVVTGAVPEPNAVFWDLIGDTTNVSGEIIAFYGD